MEIPVIKCKVVETMYQKDGKILYRPYVVLQKKFLGFIKYTDRFYLIRHDDKNKTTYYLILPSGFANIDSQFATFEQEEYVLNNLTFIVRNYLNERQKEINKIIVKVTKKVFDEK